MRRTIAGCRSLALGLALAVAACSDATGPSDDLLIGLWELEAVDGASLPATIFDDIVTDPNGNFRLEVEVLGGTIEFYGDHEYEQLVDRRAFVDDQEIPIGRFIDRGTWVRGSGDEIVLESTLYENLTTFATRNGSVIIVDQDLSGEDRQGGEIPYRFVEVQ